MVAYGNPGTGVENGLKSTLFKIIIPPPTMAQGMADYGRITTCKTVSFSQTNHSLELFRFHRVSFDLSGLFCWFCG